MHAQWASTTSRAKARPSPTLDSPALFGGRHGRPELSLKEHCLKVAQITKRASSLVCRRALLPFDTHESRVRPFVCFRIVLILSPVAVRPADTGRRTLRSGADARPAYRNSAARIRTGLLAGARGGNPSDPRRPRAPDLQSTRHDLPSLPRGRRQIGGYAVMARGRASRDFDDPRHPRLAPRRRKVKLVPVRVPTYDQLTSLGL